jgi:hypothetical protein
MQACDPGHDPAQHIGVGRSVSELLNQDFWNEATSSLPGSLPGSFTTTKSSVVWDKVLQVNSPLTTQQNVVAVLKGDVNGNWIAPTGSQDLDITTPSYFNDLAAKLGTQASQWAVIG